MKKIIALILVVVITTITKAEDFSVLRSSTNEVAVLTATLWDEARGEPYEGKVGVANVIYWRLQHRWNNSANYIQVCTSGEFSGWRKDNISVELKNELDWKAFNECYCLAVKLSKSEFVPTFEASHFESDRFSDPDWTWSMLHITQIGHHIFYLVNFDLHQIR